MLEFCTLMWDVRVAWQWRCWYVYLVNWLPKEELLGLV